LYIIYITIIKTFSGGGVMKKIRSIGAAVLYILLYYAAQLAVIFICSLAYVIRRVGDFYVGGTLKDKELAEALNAFLEDNNYLLLIIFDIVFIFSLFIIFKARGKKLLHEIGAYKTSPLNILPLVTLGFSLNILISAFISFFPDAWLKAYEESSSSVSSATGVVAVIAISFVGPLTEEILFRGLVFTRLSRGIGVYAGAVISAVIFGFAHGNLVWGIYAGILGLILASVYVYTRSLICPVMIHMSFNLAGFFVNGIDVFLLVTAFIVAALSSAAIIMIGKKRRENHSGENSPYNL